MAGDASQPAMRCKGNLTTLRAPEASRRARRRPRLGPVARSYKTEAVVLRSFRFGEADRILHVYTADRGRVGAVAKGVRKTKSRFGARLEPLSHVELMLHQGSGELHTVTGRLAGRPASAVTRRIRTGSRSGSSAPRRCSASSSSRSGTSARSRR